MYSDAVENAMTASCCRQCREAEKDHQTADNQTDAVDGIGNSNCFQAAENRVAADNADNDAQDGNTMNLLVPRMPEMSNLLKYDCTEQDDDGRLEDGVHDDDYDENIVLVPFCRWRASIREGRTWRPF